MKISCLPTRKKVGKVSYDGTSVSLGKTFSGISLWKILIRKVYLRKSLLESLYGKVSGKYLRESLFGKVSLGKSLWVSLFGKIFLGKSLWENLFGKVSLGSFGKSQDEVLKLSYGMEFNFTPSIFIEMASLPIS